MKRSQAGQAVVETILVSLLFLIPVLWALGVLADLHRGALAVSAAAREAGVDAARASSMVEADDAVGAAVAHAFNNHGLDPDDARVRWTSDANVERVGVIEVEVGYDVEVLQAPFLWRVSGPSVGVTARHATLIDPFRSRE